jgi:hypothetical protein
MRLIVVVLKRRSRTGGAGLRDAIFLGSLIVLAKGKALLPCKWVHKARKQAYLRR